MTDTEQKLLAAVIAWKNIPSRKPRTYFDVWQLAGPALSGERQKIMSALVGRKVPKSVSGVINIRAALMQLMEIDPLSDTLAGITDVISARLAEIGGSKKQ